jgi:L,D-peptidoglycan transpeptidase YkuD (ErfK/YbiS/YcfS/YnhG family)
MRLILVLSFLLLSVPASAQTCPEPLASARKLVLVTPETWTSSTAEVQRFSRTSARDVWRPDGAPVSALVGLKGVGWSVAFRRLAQSGDPVKQEGDARAPAWFFKIGRSFGFGASPLPGYLQIQADTVCVSDPRSPAYNTITSRSAIGPDVRAENMRHVSIYRRGLLVDYPTDAKNRGGSCIFVHIRRAGAHGTSGCVAVPEPDLEHLQAFAASGAVLAILPKAALARFAACLPH